MFVNPCRWPAAVHVEGALLDSHFCASWFHKAEQFIPRPGYANPPREEFLAATAIPDWARVAPRAIWGCVDMIVLRTDGEIRALLQKRSEGIASPEGKHTAPMNGFYWPIGGRVRLPPPGFCDEPFGIHEAALFKLEQEAGILPSMVAAMYPLGPSRVAFPKQMTYHYSGPEDSDRYLRKIELEYPIQAMAENYVVVLSPEGGAAATPAHPTVSEFRWLSKDQFWDPSIRYSLCRYVQDMLEAAFHDTKKVGV